MELLAWWSGIDQNFVEACVGYRLIEGVAPRENKTILRSEHATLAKAGISEHVIIPEEFIKRSHESVLLYLE